MLNNVWLKDSNDSVYQVIHNGQEMQFNRVTTILDDTRPTPVYLKRWMVNCGVEAIYKLDPSFVPVDIEDRIKFFKKTAWEAHKIESQRALSIGSSVHKSIQLPGSLATNDVEVLQSLKAYKKFSDQYHPIPLIQELTMYDTKLKVAGTLDWMGTLFSKKDIWLLDWKTSKQISDSYLVQLAVYKYIFLNFLKEFQKAPLSYSNTVQESMARFISAMPNKSKKPNIRCAVVRLDKHVPVRETTDPKFEFVELTKSQEKAGLSEFKLALKLFRHRNKGVKNDGK